LHLLPRFQRDRTDWRQLGRGPDALLRQLDSLYWTGVERDLHDILRTLQAWSQARYDAVAPPPLSPLPEDWLGFASFVNRATKEDPTGLSVASCYPSDRRPE